MLRVVANSPDSHVDLLNDNYEGVRLLKPMRKYSTKWTYVIAGTVIIGAALAFVSHRHRQQIDHYHHVRRPFEHDAASALDIQMLQGKFGNAVPTQDRQVVESVLQASNQPNFPQNPAAQTSTGSGKRRIILTYPLGTTVEDTEPTLTWDSPFDGWTYCVHIADRASYRTVATSAVLDETLWHVPSPLQRGHIYLWRVDASAPGSHPAESVVTSSAGQFSVLSDEGEQQIQRARAGNPSYLLLGSLYTHYQMWPEAVLEYRKLVNEVPDSPQAIKLLRNAELRSNAQLAAAAQQ